MTLAWLDASGGRVKSVGQDYQETTLDTEPENPENPGNPENPENLENPENPENLEKAENPSGTAESAAPSPGGQGLGDMEREVYMVAM